MRACTKCGVEKPDSMFWIDRRSGRPLPRCKSCKNAANYIWRKQKPGYESVRYQADKAATRGRHLVRKYGVTLADYERLLTAQRGCCAICRAPESEQFKGVLHVDHCHKTGAVRGLLCRGCNHMLGAVNDDPLVLGRAISYLNAYLEASP